MTENMIASIASQLLEILKSAREFGISHRSLDPDCIYVTKFDFKQKLIEIKIVGFERHYLNFLKVKENESDACT